MYTKKKKEGKSEMKEKVFIFLYFFILIFPLIASSDDIYLWNPSIRYRFPTLTYQGKTWVNGEVKADVAIKSVNVILSNSRGSKESTECTLYFLDSTKQQAVFKNEITVNPQLPLMTIEVIHENKTTCQRSYILPISCTSANYDNFGEIVAVQLSKETVRCLKFSKDNLYLIAGLDDGTIKVLDPWTLKILKNLRGHASSVRDVLITRDNKTIVSCSTDKTIKIWDIATEKCTTTLTDKEFPVESIALSPDEKYLASGSRYILLWDFPTRQFIKKMTLSYFMDIRPLVFSPDGKRLFSGDDRNSIRVWKIPDGYYDSYRYHGSSITAMTICPSMQYLYTGDKSCYMRRWQLLLDTNNTSWDGEEKLWELRVNIDKWRGCDQSDVDDYKGFFSKVKRLPVYTVTNVDDMEIDKPYNDFSQGGAMISMKVNGTGEFLMLAGRDGEVRIHETATAKCRWNVCLNKDLCSADFSDNGMMVAIGGIKGMIWIYGIP